MPLTLGNFLGMTDTRQTSQISCSCPACTGLNCLERPRFFAGQLISEAELNSEIDYMLAKQRLHNRYLHGVGTVCGLEVVCSNCEGQVIVKPGYAIDPCGNDIIVCTEQRFDLLKAIKACCDSRKKKCKTDCDPYLPAGDPGCTGLEQHWCITITYQEKPTRPTTPLRNQPKSCGCGGSCGGHADVAVAVEMAMARAREIVARRQAVHPAALPQQRFHVNPRACLKLFNWASWKIRSNVTPPKHSLETPCSPGSWNVSWASPDSAPRYLQLHHN